MATDISNSLELLREEIRSKYEEEGRTMAAHHIFEDIKDEFRPLRVLEEPVQNRCLYAALSEELASLMNIGRFSETTIFPENEEDYCSWLFSSISDLYGLSNEERCPNEESGSNKESRHVDQGEASIEYASSPVRRNLFFAACTRIRRDNDAGAVHIDFEAVNARSYAFTAKGFFSLLKPANRAAERRGMPNEVREDREESREALKELQYLGQYWDSPAEYRGEQWWENTFGCMDMFNISVRLPKSSPLVRYFSDRAREGRWFLLTSGWNFFVRDKGLAWNKKDRENLFKEKLAEELGKSKENDFSYLADMLPRSNARLEVVPATVLQFWTRKSEKAEEDSSDVYLRHWSTPMTVSVIPNRMGVKLDAIFDVGKYLRQQQRKFERMRQNYENGSGNAGMPNGVPRDFRFPDDDFPAIKSFAARSTSSGGSSTPFDRRSVYRLIAQLPMPTQMVVFDVGQGQCVGLVDEDGLPRAYVDAGCGAHKPPLQYCTCAKDDGVVFLTGWDDDHWAGARLATNDFDKFAWMVPSILFSRKELGDAYASNRKNKCAKISKLLAKVAGTNNDRIYVTSHGEYYTIPLQRDGVILCYETPAICYKKGKNKGNRKPSNDNGLVVAIVNERKKACWLLVGDAGFQTIGSEKGNDKAWRRQLFSGNSQYEDYAVVAMTACHHGAALRQRNNVPPQRPNPAEHQYARLLFSFGPDNQYGHPSCAGIRKYLTQGWQLPVKAWPKACRNEGDFLSTALKITNSQNSDDRSCIAAGWDGCPSSPQHLDDEHEIQPLT